MDRTRIHTAPVSPDMQNADVQAANERRLSVRAKAMLGLGAVVVVGAGGLMVSCNGESDNQADRASAALSAEQVAENCADISLENSAANSAAGSGGYESQSFLPRGEVKDEETTQKYINSFFSENGPLAGKADGASLAAVMSLIGTPSHDGVATNPDYNYSTEFNNRVAAYGAEGGESAAEADCKVAYDTLTQLGQYQSNWEQAGATVTRATAIRNEDYTIAGLELQEQVTNSTLSGVEVSLRSDAKGLDGFNEVLITKDGEMYLKGVIPQGSTVGEGEAEVGVDTEAQPEVSFTDEAGNEVTIKTLPDGRQEITTKDKNTGEVTQVTVPAGSNTGAGGGNSGGQDQPNGEGPNGDGDKCAGTPGGDCKGPAGGQNPVNPGPGPGPSTPGITPGTTPGTTPTTKPPVTLPPTTRPPETVPPTTKPPVTVPPTTRPPETVPPTTKPPKGPEVTIPGAPN